MSKKIVVISTSLRANSNSDALAKAFAEGAEKAGNSVEYISLRNKKIGFCMGCLACQEKGECVLKDDAIAIAEAVLNADVVAWATPIYYYEMSGQMKVLIDRMNSMFPKNYKFRDIYFLSAAAEDADYVPAKALAGLRGRSEKGAQEGQSRRRRNSENVSRKGRDAPLYQRETAPAFRRPETACCHSARPRHGAGSTAL